MLGFLLSAIETCNPSYRVHVTLVPDDSLELFQGHVQRAPASMHVSLPVPQSWLGQDLNLSWLRVHAAQRQGRL